MLKVQYRFNTELNSGFTINNTRCTREKKERGEENGGKKLKKPHLSQIIGVTANVTGVHSKFGVSRQLKIF